MDHVKGALESLFPKVVVLLELIECKMQIDLNKEVESLGGERESLKRELLSLQRKLESLKKDGDYINAVLGKSADQVEVWAEVRESSYDVEDAVDDFLVCLEGSEPIPNTDTLKRLVQKMTNLYPTEHDAMTKDFKKMDTAARPASTTTIDPCLQAMYNGNSDLVGIRDNMNRLIHLISDNKVPEVTSEMSHMISDDMLLGTCGKVSPNDSRGIPDDYQSEDKEIPSKKKPKIACVVGFGGLGKTTLVRAVYDKIKEDFSCKAFVSVGQNAKEKKVLMDILLALDKEKKEKKYTISGLMRFDGERLLKELAEFLCEKRYLVVIDDIWDEKIWNVIKCAFRNKLQLHSKVLTTTRSVNVAEACCYSSNGKIYTMEPLSDEDSKSLFYRRVFSQEGGQCPDDFKQVSAAILKKCRGVPLAIITIASLLASNGEGIKPMNEWSNLLNSIGSGLREGESVLEMNKILSLGYNDLPPELKNCLLYMAVFPEDYVIKKDRLVSRWIAEGFIQGINQEDSLFEVGENYFNLLINRSMILPVNIDGEGKAKACCVHDMVLGLLCSWSSEANFVTVLDGMNRITPMSGRKIRRLSIQDSMATASVTAQLSTASMGMAHVRSFTLLSSTIHEAYQESTSTDFSAVRKAENHVTNLVPPLSTFQVLRVLGLEECTLGMIFHQTNLCVKSLLHLKYLGLNGNVRPTEIGKLKFLQILDLKRTPLEELPSSILELSQLICLRVDSQTRLPYEFGKLTSLEKLTNVEVDKGSASVAKQLGYLTKLRVLGITMEDLDESLAKDFVESLNKLLQLRTLKLRGVDEMASPAPPGDCIMRHLEESWEPSTHLHKFLAEYVYCFSVLPKWITESSNISCLSICLEKVRSDDIEMLGRLQYLRCLHLQKEFPPVMLPAEQAKFENYVFPTARECRFQYFVTLPSMFAQGAMPKVETLEFHIRHKDCGNMNLEVLDIGHLPLLKRVDVLIWYKQKYGQKADESFTEMMHTQVEDAKAALRAAADSHPNRPTLRIFTEDYGFYFFDVPDEDVEEFESDESMRTHDDEEDDTDEDEQEDEDEARACSSDVEAVDVHPSRPPLPLTEIGGAGGSHARGTWRKPPGSPIHDLAKYQQGRRSGTTTEDMET